MALDVDHSLAAGRFTLYSWLTWCVTITKTNGVLFLGSFTDPFALSFGIAQYPPVHMKRAETNKLQFHSAKSLPVFGDVLPSAPGYAGFITFPLTWHPNRTQRKGWNVLMSCVLILPSCFSHKYNLAIKLTSFQIFVATSCHFRRCLRGRSQALRKTKHPPSELRAAGEEVQPVSCESTPPNWSLKNGRPR